MMSFKTMNSWEESHVDHKVSIKSKNALDSEIKSMKKIKMFTINDGPSNCFTQSHIAWAQQSRNLTKVINPISTENNYSSII